MNALNLDPSESVVLEVRKHWFVFFTQGLFSALAALAPFLVYETVMVYIRNKIPVGSDASALFWFVYSVWLLLVWISFFVQWTNYYLDVWFVTKKRIIDVEQKGLFHRQVSSLRFDKIQDISIEVRGILAHFFHYGDIHVQTASQDSSDFIIRYAAHPERIRQIIFEHHNREAERMIPVKVIEKNGAEQKKIS